MPETGFPFNPPGPWFDNQGTFSFNPGNEVVPNFIPSVTVVYTPTLLPDQLLPGFISSVTTLYAVETDPGQYNTAGTYSWVCPAGITNVYVQGWGGGGNGGNGQFNIVGAGGGGGAYAAGTVAVTPGNTYTITVGGATGDSSFVGDGGSQIVAKGGSSAISNNNSGPGGSAAASTGTTKFSGGTGGNGLSTASSSGGGGGGGAAGDGAGGSAGTNAVAGSAPGKAGGTGGSTGGGAGGTGSTYPTNNAVAGTFPGGGGGGANNNSSPNDFGAAGADGRVLISWGLIFPSFISSVTTVYEVVPWVHPTFISSVTSLHPIFSIFNATVNLGPGNGGEIFDIQLAPTGTSVVATLTAAFSETDAVLHLSGDSGLPSSGGFCLTIGSEVIYVKQFSSGVYTVVGRAKSNTTIAAHASGVSATWNDTYDMAITATSVIGKSFTANIGGSGSTSYKGSLICFDSTQAYIGASRYPFRVTSLLGVFDAGAGSGGTNRTDGAQAAKIYVPGGLSDNCPGSLGNPAFLTSDVAIGDVGLVRYLNPSASTLTLGSRSALLQSWFGLERVDSANSPDMSNPSATVVDGTGAEDVAHNPSSIGIDPTSGAATATAVPYVTTTLLGTSRAFTHGGTPSPPNFNDTGWPFALLCVRQGIRRVPHWESYDWHDFNYVYSGFATDATFAQVCVNRNGNTGFTPIPSVHLPNSSDITGPDAVFDDASYYFSSCVYVAIYNTPYVAIGPSIGGTGPPTSSDNTTSPVFTVTFPAGVPTPVTPVTPEGGEGGGQAPSRANRFDAEML